jgi:glycosyltransferase involved in cell wall biosynthesis
MLVAPIGRSDLAIRTLSAMGILVNVTVFRGQSGGNLGLDVDQRMAVLSAADRARGRLAVVLVDHDRSQPAPQDLIDLLSATSISGFYLLQKDPPALLPHRPFQNCFSDTLLVFPGSVIPVTMGSHRRAFQLCRNLAQHGHPVDILIAGNSWHTTRPFLEQVSARVMGYNVSRQPLKGRHFWRRQAEDLQRRLRGLQPAPMTFTENLLTKAKFSGRRALRRLVYSGRYKNIIVSYAWMDKIRDLVPDSLRKEVRWFCDTHDVQFIRNNTDGMTASRLWVEPAEEKRREVEVLRTYDHVIAISDGDSEALRTVLQPEKLVTAPNGFDYMKLDPRAPDPAKPVFGFIGRCMEANELALSEILTHWWPAISRQWPQATLRIAGEICSSHRIDSLAASTSSIVLDRHVADLPAWYQAADVLINPVVVRGGLNYKSVEALAAGRLVLTNSKGAECFADKSILAVAENGAAAATLLQALWANSNEYLGLLKTNQAKALERFGDHSAIQELLSSLKAPEPTKSRKSFGKKANRILIQAGDHHENRLRLLPLARAIRERGHHPVVMVYSRENIPALVAAGVDAVALYDYNETAPQKAGRMASASSVKNLGSQYRGFDLDDIADSAQMASPEKFSAKQLKARINELTMHIDRVMRVVDHVSPDGLIVWNGYTGYTANVLRCLGHQRGLPMFFAERSVLRDGVFLDPRGVNGYSELASIGPKALLSNHPEPARQPKSFLRRFTRHELDALRASGPWRTARRIIFVPLQVEKDTNITMHSGDFKSMADLVRTVHSQHADSGTAIVVRPHPEEVDAIEIPDLADVYIEAGGDLEAWLEIADLVVTINSTVGLTALLRGRPVQSYGEGIYTGVGLTEGANLSPHDAQALWKLLARNYLSFPESPIPESMKDILPPISEDAATEAVNPFSLDPNAAHQDAGTMLHTVRSTAIGNGALILSHDMEPSDTLNLTYRRSAEPWSDEWLRESARSSLGLPADFPVMFRNGNSSMLHVYSTPSLAARPGFDRYMWPIPRVSGPRRGLGIHETSIPATQNSSPYK